MRFIRLVALSAAIAAPAEAQIADHYRGTVVDSLHSNAATPFEYVILSRTDSTTTGMMRIARPDTVSGFASVIHRGGDSISLVMMRTADTLVFSSPRQGDALGGRYVRFANGNVMERGGWSGTVEPHFPPLVLTAISAGLGVAMVVLILFVASRVQEPWWRKQAAGTIATLTDDQRKKWKSIGGWLLWNTLGSSAIAIYMIATLPSLVETFSTSWVVGVMVPQLRVQLLLENATHVFQALALTTGVVLTIRKSHLAPPFWFGTLAVLAGYGIADAVATNGVTASVIALYGAETSAEVTREVTETTTQNLRLALSAFVWMGYWFKSRRVWLVFSPAARTTSGS